MSNDCGGRGMKIRKYEIKQKCNNPKFLVIETCQGQPFYYCYHSLVGAVIGYCKQYLTKKKYNTMSFKLREVLTTDFEEKGEEE